MDSYSENNLQSNKNEEKIKKMYEDYQEFINEKEYGKFSKEKEEILENLSEIVIGQKENQDILREATSEKPSIGILIILKERKRKRLEEKQEKYQSEFGKQILELYGKGIQSTYSPNEFLGGVNSGHAESIWLIEKLAIHLYFCDLENRISIADEENYKYDKNQMEKGYKWFNNWKEYPERYDYIVEEIEEIAKDIWNMNYDKIDLINESEQELDEEAI